MCALFLRHTVKKVRVTLLLQLVQRDWAKPRKIPIRRSKGLSLTVSARSQSSFRCAWTRWFIAALISQMVTWISYSLRKVPPSLVYPFDWDKDRVLFKCRTGTKGIMQCIKELVLRICLSISMKVALGTCLFSSNKRYWTSGAWRPQ